MRYAIFSDIHANLQAFREAVKFYEKEDIDIFIFNGDVVGYGGDPDSCTELLRELNPVCLAGNHDWAVLEKIDTTYFNPYARRAIEWTKVKMKSINKQYLGDFKMVHREKDFVCVHSAMTDPEEFPYILNETDAYRNFRCFKEQLCFVGHSHRQETYIEEKDIVFVSTEKALKIEAGKRYILNAGSIGQPRDGDPRLSLSVYDSDSKIITFTRLSYDIEEAANKILKRGLPGTLASRLYKGF